MSEENNVNIFEVYRVGSVTKEELAKLPFDAVKAKYTILSPIEEFSQITEKTLLATVPKEGHMIVDKQSYHKLLNSKVEEAVKNVKIQSDEKLCRAVENVERERREVAQILKLTILKQRENLLQFVNTNSAEERSKNDMIVDLKKLLEEQNHTMNLLFSSPLFNDNEE